MKKLRLGQIDLRDLHSSEIASSNGLSGANTNINTVSANVDSVSHGLSGANSSIDLVQGNAASFASYANATFSTVSGGDPRVDSVTDNLNSFGSYANTTFATDTNLDIVQGNTDSFASYANTTFATLTGTETLENKTLRAPTFESGNNSPELLETRYVNATQQDFVQLYTGGANGNYFTQGEYQKIATIIPDADSQNYTFIIRMTATSASNYQIVTFTGALRSNTLPDLTFTTNYNEEHNGVRFIEPKLWTKETATAGFILAFEYVHNQSLYGGVNVEAIIIPRSDAQRENVTFNTTQDSEVTSIDSGYTENDPTLVYSQVSGTFEFGTQFRIEGSTSDGNELTITATDPTADRTATFPDATGHVALFASDPGSNTISSTPTELNLLDGVTGLTLGNANELLVVDSDGTGITTDSVLTIDPSSNYIGINQANPEVTLHMTGEGAQSSQIRMEQYNDTADAPDLRTRRFRGSPSSPAEVQAGDYLYRMNIEAWDNSANTTYSSMQFDVASDDQDALNWRLQTRDTAGTNATRMKIDSNGAIHFNEAYKFPTSDGSASQILQTDGNGNITFADAATGDGNANTVQSNLHTFGSYANTTFATDTNLNIVQGNAASFASYSNTTFATTTYVDNEVANLVNGAPGTLDTLNELAAALGNDANLSVTLTTKINTISSNTDSVSHGLSGANTNVTTNKSISDTFGTYANSTFATGTNINTVSSNVDSVSHGLSGANTNVTTNKSISDTFGSYANSTFATDTNLNIVSGNLATFASYANSTFGTGSGSGNAVLVSGNLDSFASYANSTFTITTTNAASDQFTTVATSNTFTLSESENEANNLIVTLGGLLQKPNDDYIVSDTTLTLNNTNPLISGVAVEVRHLPTGGSSSSGGVTTGKAIAMSLVFGF